MSMDRSLVLKSQLTRHRSILSRTERLKVLLGDGRWSEGDSVFGLPKVRTYVARRKVKKEKEKEAAPAVATAEAAAALAEATPTGGKKPAATGAKPAKGAAPK